MFTKCTTRNDPDGVTTFLDANGNEVALVLPFTGRVVDMRENPPYLSMSPCPYCGCENDRGHNPLKHTDPFLGISI